MKYPQAIYLLNFLGIRNYEGSLVVIALKEEIKIVRKIVDAHWNSQSGVTTNYRDSLKIAEQQFQQALTQLNAIASDLAGVEAQLQAEGAPWTPGRIPQWP